MTKSYNLREIRKLINEALGDDELTNLCFDHFRPVYDKFTTGQVKPDRIRMLVEYAERQREIPKLLKAIEKINPKGYAEFKSGLVLENEPETVKSWLDDIDPQKLGIRAGGSVYTVNIGDNNKNIMIGQNITQTINTAVGRPQTNDYQQVVSAIAEFKASFEMIKSSLSDRQRFIGEDKINALEKQLTKQDESPSGEIIREAGDWLIENIPEIGEALLRLFLPQPVGRILAKASAATIKWVKELQMRQVGQ